MANSEPIVILYKSLACSHCTKLTEIWDKSASKDKDSVVSAMKKVYPRLRVHVVSVKDMSGSFDENVVPKDLIRYRYWFPMILLVPGRIWDNAMANLGPKNEAKIRDGVQIMNGAWGLGPKGEEKINHDGKYNPIDPAEFARWLKDAMQKDDFKAVQNGFVLPPTPVVQLPQPVAPPPTQLPVQLPPVAPVKQAIPVMGDTCSMRLISRPK